MVGNQASEGGSHIRGHFKVLALLANKLTRQVPKDTLLSESVRDQTILPMWRNRAHVWHRGFRVATCHAYRHTGNSLWRLRACHDRLCTVQVTQAATSTIPALVGWHRAWLTVQLSVERFWTIKLVTNACWVSATNAQLITTACFDLQQVVGVKVVTHVLFRVIWGLSERAHGSCLQQSPQVTFQVALGDVHSDKCDGGVAMWFHGRQSAIVCDVRDEYSSPMTCILLGCLSPFVCVLSSHSSFPC